MKLICHPAHPCKQNLSIEAQAVFESPKLILAYDISGPIHEILFPLPSSDKKQPSPSGERSDLLWKTTCFEAFLKINKNNVNHQEYWEFNLSPNGNWNCYYFSNYRTNMKEENLVQSPIYTLKETTSKTRLTFEFDLSKISQMSETSVNSIQLGLSAVIEDLQHNISYWALRHLSSEPDFHHASSFILTPSSGEVLT